MKPIRLLISVFLFSILLSVVYALPVPHGVEGVVYELDAITQVRKGTDFYVHNLNNNYIIQGKIGRISPGKFSVSLKGNDGDVIVIKAWNKYNQVNITLTLNGIMRNIDLFLNMTFPPIAPNITSQPITNSIEDSLYSYQIEAFDENDNTLDYSLVVYPFGMVINRTNGLITWLPLNQHVGMHNVTLQVSDGIFLTNQSFTLQVQNVNDMPSIISIPITNATQDTPYFYDVDGIDEDNDILNYLLLIKPWAMIINSSTGLINWTPNNSQIGLHEVYVKVSDGNLTDTQNFTINVANVNDLPYISSLPVTTGKQDTPYNYDVDANDVDNDFLNYSLVYYPQRMKMNNTNGNITWLPSNNDVGIHNITVKVSDDKGYVLHPFALIIENVNDKPVINSTPLIETKLGRTYTYDVDAYDIDNDPLRYALIVAPNGMSIDNDIITWLPKGIHRGNNTVIVEVSDGNLTDTQQFYVLVSEIPITKPSEVRGGGGSKTIIKGRGDETKPVIEAVIPIKNVMIKVEELSEKPRGIESVSKRVYKYLKIETEDTLLENSIINFTVEHSWMGDNEIKIEDIILTRYTSEGWRELSTKNVSKDDKHVYYSALTHGFSFFAITVKDGIITKSILSPQISKIEVPYRISGVIYKFGKFKQVDKGTNIIVENLNTSEIFLGETGIGPFDGAYYVLMYGKEGDLIKIKIGAINDEYLTILEDRDINFMSNSLNTGFTPITGYALFAILSDSILISIIIFLIVVLLALFVRFKKR